MIGNLLRPRRRMERISLTKKARAFFAAQSTLIGETVFIRCLPPGSFGTKAAKQAIGVVILMGADMTLLIGCPFQNHPNEPHRPAPAPEAAQARQKPRIPCQGGRPAMHHLPHPRRAANRAHLCAPRHLRQAWGSQDARQNGDTVVLQAPSGRVRDTHRAGGMGRGVWA